MAHQLPKALILSAPLLLLAGCGEEPPPETPDVSRPVKTVKIETPVTGGVRNFPARIDAADKAELAFRVPGKVQSLKVKEGDRVEAGQLVAELDPKDYEIVLNDRQATYDNSVKNYERAKGLIKKGFISQMDYDRLEAEFKNSRAALNAARQDLSYTKLEAPFKGLIAKRYIQQFEEVLAKQVVLDLQNVNALDVKFDVPESIIRGIRADEEERAQRRDAIKVTARFEGLPGQQFELKFKEVATKADPQTQTFEVTYLMDQVESATILPGMTANVTLDLSQLGDMEAVFSVPVSAVVGDYKLDPRAWVVDEVTMTVSPQSVGRMMGEDIEVLEGLEPGMRIVTAGTPFLVEGMKVTLMANLEQAEPRPDDSKYQ